MKKLKKDQFKIKELPTELVPEIEGLLNINLTLIGEGTFSKVYSIKGKQAVLKITKDENEIKILKRIKENNLEHLPKLYQIKKYKDYYIAIMEKLYINDQLKDDLKIIMGTRLSSKGDELDILISENVYKAIKSDDLKEKFENIIISDYEIFVSSFLRALALKQGLMPWTKEYKKNLKEIQYILDNFSKEEIKIILKYIGMEFKKLDDDYPAFIDNIINSIEDLLSIGVFHVDVAVRNMMKRKNGELILIDYNLAFID